MLGKFQTSSATVSVAQRKSSQMPDLKKFSYHFVGIGGIGMSAIAQVLREQGHIVSGSDRNYDKQITPYLFSALACKGISLHPQDSSGVKEDTDFVVISSAIEEDNPDIKKALVHNKKIIKRADLLSDMFNRKYGIAIGGTNGKTTVSCMAGYILDYAGLSPTVIVGGCIKNYIDNFHLGNAMTGTSDIVSIEADESDGSIVLYTPRIAVITNISKDHKSIDEISKMFVSFSQNTTETLIVNADCPRLKMIELKHKNIITYGLNNNAVIHAAKLGCKRVITIFQPHGYSPTIFMKEEFINAFINVLSPRDVLFMPEIYYAGGTASKNISSADIIKRVKESGKNAFFIEKRTDILPEIKERAQTGDCILVMGARDNTLTEFCQNILRSLQNK